MCLKTCHKAIHNLQIATIAIPNKIYPEGTMGMITGWGQTTHINGERADVLQMAMTPLVDLLTCRQEWGSRITPRMQCVGGTGLNSGCKVILKKTLYFFSLRCFLLLIQQIIISNWIHKPNVSRPSSPSVMHTVLF